MLLTCFSLAVVVVTGIMLACVWNGGLPWFDGADDADCPDWED